MSYKKEGRRFRGGGQALNIKGLGGISPTTRIGEPPSSVQVEVELDAQGVTYLPPQVVTVMLLLQLV